jgi:tripartite-type tricarboxylate transporter receptor subunit TctC
MMHPFSFVVLTIFLAGLFGVPCAQAAPTIVAEGTKILVAQATPATATARKVDFPAKGKVITAISPVPAGGGSDVSLRVLAEGLKKELGVSIEVVNKPGAGMQAGITELLSAKPDGYTICNMTLPNVQLIYLDPERQAAFSRKNLQPVANYVSDVGLLAVKANSPFKTIQDLVNAAKAGPGKIKLSTTGILGPHHVAILKLQKMAGVKFAIAHFSGGAPGITALLGGHTDGFVGFGADAMAQIKSGDVRVLGIADTRESMFYPGIKTMEAQGYKLHSIAARLIAAPGGTPRQIVNILSEAVKRAMETDAVKTKMKTLGVEPHYMDPDQLSSYWAQVETEVKPFVEEARAEK